MGMVVDIIPPNDFRIAFLDPFVGLIAKTCNSLGGVCRDVFPAGDGGFEMFACPWFTAVNEAAHDSISEEGCIGRVVTNTGVRAHAPMIHRLVLTLGGF